MANKKTKEEFKTEKYQVDNDLDFKFDDFNFDDSMEEIPDDRSAIARVSGGAMEGFKSGVANSSNIKKMVTSALPESFGSAFDLAGESTSTLRDLYNNTGKELKPVIKEMRKMSKRIAPAVDKVLPKALSEKFTAWANAEDENRGQNFDPNEATINSTLGDIFKTGLTEDDRREKEADVKESIKEGMEQTRHKDQLAQLNDIRTNVISLNQYQNTVGVNYQRKSLELQMRQYFVAQDLLISSKQNFAEQKNVLDGILKNSALPDFAKQQKDETFKQIMRNKFMDSLAEGIFDKRRGFIRNVGKNISKAVSGKVKSAVSDFSMGFESVNQLLEMQEEYAKMGIKMDPLEMAGGEAGEAAAGGIMNWMGRQGRKVLGKQTRVVKLGNELNSGVKNLPQQAMQWAKSDAGDDKWYSFFTDILKSSVRSSMRVDDSIETHGLADQLKPQPFSSGAHKSITEIIPGMLARIHREIKILRTGDANVDLLSYDLINNKFSTERERNIAAMETIVDKDSVSSTSNQLEKILADVDPKKTLKPKEREKVGRYLMDLNLRNGLGDEKTLTDVRGYGREHQDIAEKFSELVKTHLANDPTSSKKGNLKDSIGEYGKYVSSKQSQIQHLQNSGYGDLLRKQQLLDESGERVDIKKLYDMFLNGYATFAEQRDREAVEGYEPPPTKIVPDAPGEQLPSNTRLRSGNRTSSKVIQHVSSNNADVVAAVTEQSVIYKTASDLILDEVKKINTQLESGIHFSGQEGTGAAGGKRKWWDKSIGNILGSGASGIMSLARSGREIVKSGVARATKVGGYMGDRAKDVAAWALGKRDYIKEVWIKGELEPRLTEAKLKAGEYYDSVSKKVITDFKDIKGAVLDKDGKVVMDREQIKNALMDSGHGKYSRLVDILGKGWDAGKALVGRIGGAYGFMGVKALQVAKWGTKQAVKLKNRLLDAQDVFVVGDPLPRLRKVVMLNGGYFDDKTLDEIHSVADIKGPVLDNHANILISHEDLSKGLVNAQGEPLKSGLARVWQLAKEQGNKIYKASKGALDWGKKKGKQGLELLGRGLNKVFGNGINILSGNTTAVEIMGAKSVDVLTQIRDILDSRLPGGKKKKVIGDLSGDGVRDGSIADMHEKAKETATDTIAANQATLIDKYKDKLGGHVAAGGTLLAGGIATAKQKIQELKAKKEELDKAKEEGGDSAGGGIIDYLIGERISAMLGKGKGKIKGAGKWLANKAGGLGRMVKGAGSGIARGVGGLLGRGAAVAGAGTAAQALGGAAATTAATAATTAATTAAATTGAAALAAPVAAGVAGAAAPALASAATAAGGSLLGAGATTAAGTIAAEAAIGGMSFTTALGAVGTGLLGLLASPLVLGALAVGAVAGGIYLYNRNTRDNLKTITKLRFTQYGFNPVANKEKVHLIFNLEEAFDKAVYFDNGQAKIDPKKLDLKSLLGIFDIDQGDNPRIALWSKWALKRFKPVYLMHRTAMQKVKPNAPLDSADDSLSVIQKQEYLQMAKFENGPYSELDSPFTDIRALPSGPMEVKAAIAEALATNAKEAAKDPGAQAAKKLGVATTVTAATAITASLAAKAMPAATTAGPITSKSKSDLTNLNGLGGNNNGITITAGASLLDVAFGNRLDAFTAVRFKAYGINEMEADKVNSIAKLEQAMGTDLKFDATKRASWNGNPARMLSVVGGAFGATDPASPAGLIWLKWFSLRFLPVYLDFMTGVYKATGKSDVKAAALSMTGKQKLDVALMVLASKSDAGPVWNVAFTPWVGYTLNMDVKSTDGNVAALKESTKSNMTEEEAKAKAKSGNGEITATGTLAGATGGTAAAIAAKGNEVTSAAGGKTPSFWEKTKSAVSSAASTVGGGAADLLNSAADTLGFGPVIKAGKAGGYTNIPGPNGPDGKYSSVKAMIDAASDIVGVDPGLMAAMAAQESSFKYAAKAGTSSATGLYQFVKKTWAGMMKKYGNKFGIPEGTGPEDPKANTLLGAAYIRDNAAELSSVKKDLSATDLYLAHFLGPAGAKKLLRAPPTSNAVELMPDAAASNYDVFFKDGKRRTQPRTVAEVYQFLQQTIARRLRQVGITASAGSEAIVPVKASVAPAAVAATAAAAGAPAAPKTTSASGNTTVAPVVATATVAGVAGKNKVAGSDTSPSPTPDAKPSKGKSKGKAKAAPVATADSVGTDFSGIGVSATTAAAIIGAGSGSVQNASYTPETNSKPAPIEIADQTPGMGGYGGSVKAAARTAPFVPAKANAHSAPEQSDMGGFTQAAFSTNTRRNDLADQARYQRDSSAKVFGSIDDTLTKTLVENRVHTDLLKKILDVLGRAPAAAAPTESKSDNAPPNTRTNPPPTRQSHPSTPVPVSMRRLSM